VSANLYDLPDPRKLPDERTRVLCVRCHRVMLVEPAKSAIEAALATAYQHRTCPDARQLELPHTEAIA
jgi:hypothetical protein